MYWNDKMPHEDRARIVSWAANIGLVMTLAGWLVLAFASDKGLLLIPTTFTIVALSVIMADKQSDEFHRGMAKSGAIGGMMAVLLWTAFVPLFSDYFGPQNATLDALTSEHRVTFFIAATGFFFGFFRKRLMGDAA